MRTRTPALVAVALALTACLTACSGSTPSTSGGSSGSPAYVTDGTFTIAQVSDPGALDPQMSIVAGLFDMTGYAYDSIVGLSPTGQVLPQLAKSWTTSGNATTFTINSGITCSDGSALTATTIANNISWMEDSQNASPYLGAFLPVGTATADASANTVTFTPTQPAPFLLSSLANVPIVCDAGLTDRSKLDGATLGSGPYVLTEAVPNDHYTYVRRDGYTWGPGGATTAAPGMPKTIVVKIVPDESTSVNLLLSGQVNAVTTVGSDGDRAKAAGMQSVEVPANLGFTWYNQAAGHPTADPAVREALTQALNLTDLATAITGGEGGPAKSLAVVPPASCSYDSITGNLPSYSTSDAQATLEQDGYTKGADGMYTKDGQPLTITFLYDSALGTAGQSAAELAMQQWKDAGITVNAQSQATAQISQVLFGTGAWDVAWEPINVNSPDQMVSYLSGPTLADGGSNFASINDANYTNAVNSALQQTGDAACAGFQQAETALIKDNDLVVWAERSNQIYLNKVQYAYNGRTDVTALRMLA